MPHQPLGELSAEEAAQIKGTDVPRMLNRSNKMGYTTRIVSILLLQRRRSSNVRSATNHRNKTKLITAGLKATINAMAAEIRELRGNRGGCALCTIAETKLRTIAKVYDCSPFVLDPFHLTQ
jgi:hypothetical protein